MHSSNWSLEGAISQNKIVQWAALWLGFCQVVPLNSENYKIMFFSLNCVGGRKPLELWLPGHCITVSQYQRATGKGGSRNLEQGFQQKGAYLLRVWHHKGHEGIHRHHPWGDGGSKAFSQEWPKRDILPLLDVSCYGKTASLGLTVAYRLTLSCFLSSTYMDLFTWL